MALDNPATNGRNISVLAVFDVNSVRKVMVEVIDNIMVTGEVWLNLVKFCPI